MPTAAGPRAAYLILGNTSANPSIAIALSGTGTADSAGPVTLSPGSLAFAQLGIPQTLTLTNAGSMPLSINGIRISSTGYTQTNNCGSSLPASSSCLIEVSVPTNTFDTSATLTVVDYAAAEPQVAHLSFPSLVGAGFPALVDFGHWSIGAMGEELFEVVGPGTSGTLNFTITGPNAGGLLVSPGIFRSCKQLHLLIPRQQLSLLSGHFLHAVRAWHQHGLRQRGGLWPVHPDGDG